MFLREKHNIRDDLFRHLAPGRLCEPVSKQTSADELFSDNGEANDVARFCRYLDKLHKKPNETLQQISYGHTLKLLQGNISVVFLKVTPLYFEPEQQQERSTGLRRKASGFRE